MKKLIFIFVLLFVLVIVTGCNLHKNTISLEPKDDETVSEESNEDTDTEGKITTEDIKLAVTSIIGKKLETEENHHVIRGLTPSNTYEMKIGDYTLQKYIPGDTEWSYIASTGYGTLFEGENNYTVYAYDKDGNELDSYDFTIVYTAPGIPNLPSVGINTWIILIISTLISTVFFAFRRLKKVFIKD